MQIIIDVSNMVDIGRAIMYEQARLSENESVCLYFQDGGEWRGQLTLSRDTDEETYFCEGVIFHGDRSIPVSFVGDADGPIGLPIRSPSGKIWTDDEEAEQAVSAKHSFYADGCNWTRENAPAVKVSHARAGQKLSESAQKAETKWEKGSAKVGNTWFSAKDLLKAGPETEEWPRKMPRPAARSSRKEPRKVQKPLVQKNGVFRHNKTTGELIPLTGKSTPA